MILQVISLYDVKACAYLPPQCVQSIGGAIRGFSDEINRAAADNVMYQHPADFLLYLLGEFDDETGRIVMHEDRRLLASGSEHTNKSAG